MTRSFTRQALAATALIFALQPFTALAADREDGIPEDGGAYHTDTRATNDRITRAMPVAFTSAQRVRPAQSNGGMVPTAAEPDPADLHN